MSKLHAHFLILLATLLISATFPACKILAGSMHPLALTLVRFIIASVSLSPIVFLNKHYRKQILHCFPRSIIISFFYCAYFFFMFSALETTTAIHTGSLATMSVPITAILSIFFFKEKIRISNLFLFLIGFVGTLWVVFDGDWNSVYNFHMNHGDFIFLLGVFMISFYTIFLRKLYRNDSTIVLAFCTVTSGIIWMGLGVLFFQIPIDFSAISTLPKWMSLFYLAIFTTSITAYLYQKGSTVLTPNDLNAYAYIQPVFIALLSIPILNIIPAPDTWMGISLSIIATIGLILTRGKKIKKT